MIKSACRQISENPNIGKVYADVDSNILGYRSGKHIVFYHFVSADEIEIIRILHVQMDLKNRITE